MNSKDCRCLETFLRSKYQGNNELGIPFIRKQEIDLTDVCLISYSDTRENASAEARKKGVHFFLLMIIGLKVFIKNQKSLLRN